MSKNIPSKNEDYKKDKSLCIDDKNALPMSHHVTQCHTMSHHVQEGHLFSSNCHYKPIII